MSRQREEWNSAGELAVSGWRWTLAACALLAGLCAAGTAAAVELERPVNIGVLTTTWGTPLSVPGLRQGLLELGYAEYVDFTIGVRFTSGDPVALKSAAQELVKAGAHIIFAGGTEGTAAALEATSEIPIVFFTADDPLGFGLIESYAHPGRNVTGISDLDDEIAGKRLEIFRDLIPKLQRVMFPFHEDNEFAVRKSEIYRRAAEVLGLEFLAGPYRTEEQARTALAELRNGGLDGIVSPRMQDSNILGLMLEATSQRGIPTMFSISFMVESGGLVSYGPDYFQIGVQAARIVDKIIKGADPGEIPVEVNNTIELVINLKVAEELGITVAPEVLYQADRIIR